MQRLLKTTTALIFSFVLTFLVALSGCTDARKEWAAARVTLTQTENLLTTAHQTGALSDRDFLATGPSVYASRASLQQADEELIASKDKPTDRFRYYMRLAVPGLKVLQRPPTTLPTQPGG